LYTSDVIVSPHCQRLSAIILIDEK
jgi:hypothetical protein